MIVNNKKLAQFAGIAEGTILSDDEFEAVLVAFNAKRAEEDEERFQDALATAPNNAHVVTDTWTHGGICLRRGEVVYLKRDCDGLGSVMVTRSNAKTAQGFIWTCSLEEAEAHCSHVIDLCVEQAEELEWVDGGAGDFTIAASDGSWLSYGDWGRDTYGLHTEFDGKRQNVRIFAESRAEAVRTAERKLARIACGWRAINW